jgi:hypothetical protein
VAKAIGFLFCGEPGVAWAKRQNKKAS